MSRGFAPPPRSGPAGDADDAPSGALKTGDFDYDLPKSLIAQTPVEPRDHSRLMVLSRLDGSISHRRFYDLPDYLRSGDVLVFNDSRVFPARVRGRRAGTGGRVELLLLHRLERGVWQALTRPGRRMRADVAFELSGPAGSVKGRVLEVNSDGSRTVALSDDDLLMEIGDVPLPPYVHEPLDDVERYQTVYARALGSVAAPTAGLHFTRELLDRVRSMGVETVFVTLHVGWDSFRPVQGDNPAGHEMHSEHWELDEGAAQAINDAKQQGRRVVSVGTTAVRLLEHAALLQERSGVQQTVAAGSGWTELFIYPGHRFRVVDALVTNFHLPRSTLLMLTSALAGRDRLLRGYLEAIAKDYLFYSLGDAMLIS